MFRSVARSLSLSLPHSLAFRLARRPPAAGAQLEESGRTQSVGGNVPRIDAPKNTCAQGECVSRRQYDASARLIARKCAFVPVGVVCVCVCALEHDTYSMHLYANTPNTHGA